MNVISVVFRAIAIVSAVLCAFMYVSIESGSRQQDVELSLSQTDAQQHKLDLDSAMDVAEAMKERLTAYEERLAAEAERVQKLRKLNAEAKSQLSSLRSDISRLTTNLGDKDALVKRMQLEIAGAGSIPDVAPAQVAAYESTIRSLSNEVGQLKGIVSKYQATPKPPLGGPVDTLPGLPQGKAFRGQIITVSRSGQIVSVNVGRTHGVTDGMNINIYKGDKLLATLRASTVQQNATTGRILPDSPDPLGIQKGAAVIFILDQQNSAPVTDGSAIPQAHHEPEDDKPDNHRPLETASLYANR